MKIKIKREGGFIGITSKADLEYDQLTTEEQNLLNSLVDKSVQSAKKTKEIVSTEKITPPSVESKADDITLAPSLKGRNLDAVEPKSDDKGMEMVENQMPHTNNSNMMRDAFSYSISMKKDGKTVSMKFDDMTAPPEIVEIFQKYVQY